MLYCTITDETWRYPSYSYDWAGNLTQTQDEAGNLTTLTYDNFGRKTYMKDPDMGRWRYEYDALGNMTSQKDLVSGTETIEAQTCLYYDQLNRLVAKNIINSCPATPASSGSTWLATYIYYTSATGTAGETGKLAEVRWNRGDVADSTDKELFDYDSFGRLTRHERQLEGLSFVMQYGSFDRLNRPTAVTYPDGTVANVGYDHEGEDTLQISNSGLASGDQNLVTDVMFNQRGQLHKIDRSTNMDTFYDYYGATGTAGTGNSNFRLSGLRHGGVAGDSFPDFGYTYDQRGNLLTLAESGQSTFSYTYDHLSRLTDYRIQNSPTALETYNYSAIGNFTIFKGATVSYTGSQPHAATSRSGNYYGYDDNGNMTSRTEAGISYTQNFDKENRLTSVVTGGQTTTFRYDPSGQRTMTIEPNGVKTYFPFPNYEYEVNGATTKQRSTYSLAGQAIAIRERVNSNAPTFYYLYTDHLGSTSMMAYTMGGVLAGSTARYTPFGEYVGGVAPSQTVTDRGFTGHQHNDSIKLIYMNARFYVPGLGRFASADTIVPNAGNPQSYNRYSYVYNNPLNYTDPTGHDGMWCNDPSEATSGCNATPKPKIKQQTSLVTFTGEGWSDGMQEDIKEGANDVAEKLAETLNDIHPTWNLTPEEAFFYIYGGSVNFHWFGKACSDDNKYSGCGARAIDIRDIRVYTDARPITNVKEWAVHELGHSFVYASGYAAGDVRNMNNLLKYYQSLESVPYQGGRSVFPIRDNIDKTLYFGFASTRTSPLLMQQSLAIDSSAEEVADMFLGWVYGSWETDEFGNLTIDGAIRSEHMNRMMLTKLKNWD